MAEGRKRLGPRAGTRAGTAPWEVVEASFVAAAGSAASLPPALGVEIAFAGRSNVGKSSLMNALMGRRRLVRTSATPGCTRSIAFFRATARDGAVLTLVDLPGFGYAGRSQAERRGWAALVEGYLGRREQLVAVALLFDARRGLEDAEAGLIELLVRRGLAVVLVATKIDKLPPSGRKAALARLGAKHPAIGVSATTGEGIEALWQTLRRASVPLGT